MEVGRPVVIKEQAINEWYADPTITESGTGESHLVAVVQVGQEINLTMPVDGRHIERDSEMLHEIAGEGGSLLGMLRHV